MTRFESFLDRLASAQASRPWLFLLVALGLGAGAFPVVKSLELDSSFTALLPTYKPSVQDLERIGRRVGGLQSLTVVLESRDLPAMQRFARDLVPRLERIGPPLVRSVEWNVATYEDFVWSHRHLYADTADLVEVRDALEERLNWERARANPLFVQLDDYEPADPRDVVRRIERRAQEGRQRMARFPGGFYVHPNGRLLAIFVKSDISGGSSRDLRALTSAVLREAEALRPASYARDLRVELAGPVIAQREEHQAIETELVLATSLSVVLVLGIIWIFFRRFRSVPVILFALGVPTLLTFAFAKLAVGSLNTSTAFLGSIVVGNGVNPNIMWLARYFEERKRGRDVRDAISFTHRNVAAATFAAALAAAVAYGSLMVTDFRGFRDFGVIGFVGMELCWLGAMLVLPAAAAAFDRLRPLVFAPEKASSFDFGSLVSRLVHRSPKTIVLVSSVLTVIGIGLAGYAIAHDPLEYDFRKLRSESRGATTAQRLNPLVSEIKGGGQISENIAVVFERAADVAPFQAALEARRARGGAPWSGARSIDDLLPRDQPEKIALLGEIRSLLLDFRAYADEETRTRIDEHMPPEGLRVLTRDDIPEEVARPYSERDGTRGRLLLVVRRSGVSIWDGRYLMDWARELRAVTLPDGTRPPLAGRAPMFADMIESILEDGPKAIAASFGITIALVIFSFRTLRQRLLTLSTLLFGVVWMTGMMALFRVKLNFLNFVAFPITFGNGVDYGVNVMKRYVLERDQQNVNAVREAISESGGAVVVCSLTTVFGYATLLVSTNLALKSFGLSMAISELTCLFAAVVTMPSMLLLLERKDASAAKEPT